MSVSTTVSISITLAGQSFPESRTVTADGEVAQSITQAAANSCTLADDGVTVTLTSGHTVVNGRVDVYWAAGTRLGCTMAGVTGPTDTSGTLSGGVGDALPAVSGVPTTVQITNPTEMNIDLTGDDLQSIAFYSQTRGGIAVVDDGDVEAFQKNLASGGTYLWWNGNGDTNPVAGDVIAKVFASHNGTASASIRVGFTYNN